MKNAYPIVITEGNNLFVVDIPDFAISTQGTSIADAMEMARDAIGLVGITLEDEGKPLPTPRELSALSAVSRSIVTLVDVDFTLYRRRNDRRTVRKNVTVPAWLAAEAEKSGLNFSAILTAALKSELGSEDECDLAAYEEAFAEYVKNGRKSRPVEELWKELSMNNLPNRG